MKLKNPKNQIILFFFFITPFLHAQKVPIKWGKVDRAELDMAVYPLDSTAEAVVLADYGSLRFDFAGNKTQYILSRHCRIKILNRSGFSRGDISLPYYGNDYVTGLKAQIINPDGTETSLKKSDFFEEEVTESKRIKKFSFPNVQEGSIIEYQYELHSEHYFHLEEWYFQNDIPIQWSEYRLEIPEWFVYIALNQGRPLDINEKGKESKSIYFPGAGSANVMVEKHRYVMKDVPALKEENYVTTMYDYLARIQFQLQSFEFPNEPSTPVFTEWSKVAEELMQSNGFGQQFLKRRNFKDISESLAAQLATATDDAEKADIIYYTLASQMKWNGVYSFSSPEGLNNCFALKEANSGELNLLMLALLKEQGITAYPILISTRHHGKTIPLYPILSQFNHVLVLADINGNATLMDLNNPYRPIGFPRANSLNGQGWLVDEENNQWISMTPPENVEASIIQISIGKEGQLSGSYKHRLEGYDAANHRAKISDDKEGGFIKDDLIKRYPELSIQKLEFENLADPKEALMEIMDFTLPNAAQVAGDFMYFSPSLFSIFDKNPLKTESRTYPVNMPYPFRLQRILMFDIPEGFSVEELPEGLNLVLPNDGGSFLYSVKQMGSKLQATSRIKISQTVFQPEEYLAIKGFFDMIIEKQEEQIVLKKKT